VDAPESTCLTAVICCEAFEKKVAPEARWGGSNRWAERLTAWGKRLPLAEDFSLGRLVAALSSTGLDGIELDEALVRTRPGPLSSNEAFASVAWRVVDLLFFVEWDIFRLSGRR
jgi:hypothetical protein